MEDEFDIDVDLTEGVEIDGSSIVETFINYINHCLLVRIEHSHGEDISHCVAVVLHTKTCYVPIEGTLGHNLWSTPHSSHSQERPVNAAIKSKSAVLFSSERST